MRREQLPSVSVVVPTYNRRANLERVVAPLLDDPAAIEVLVVVDGCRDGSYELLQELAARDSRLKPLFIENRGSAFARLIGVQRAVGDVVLLLDDDVVAAPGLVSGHARRQAEGEGRVVIGYMPIRDWRDSPRPRFTSYLYAREYEATCRRYELPPDDILLGLWAGNISLRRLDCLRVPPYEPQFPSGRHVDREFGLRCRKAGLVGVFDRSLLAEHVHERSLDQLLRDAFHQGSARVLLHRVHRDVLGPFDIGLLEANRPSPVRLLVRISCRPPAHRIIMAALRPMVTVTGRLGLFPLELRGGQLLRRIELRRGALSQLAAEANAAPPTRRGQPPRLATDRSEVVRLPHVTDSDPMTRRRERLAVRAHYEGRTRPSRSVRATKAKQWLEPLTRAVKTPALTTLRRSLSHTNPRRHPRAVAAIIGATALVPLGYAVTPGGHRRSSGVSSGTARTAAVRSPRLGWAPPTLQKPVNIVVTRALNVVLDPSRDYVIRMPLYPVTAVYGCIHVVGGHNIVIIGGECYVPSQPTPSKGGGRALDFERVTGTVHVEGFWAHGPGLTDGLDIFDSPRAILQVENSRFDDVDNFGLSSIHSDLIQADSLAQLRVDRFTGSSEQQGIFRDGGTPAPDGADLRHINISKDVPRGRGARALWQSAKWYRMTLHDFYLVPLPGHRVEDEVWPGAHDRDYFSSRYLARVTRRGSIYWPPAVNIHGVVHPGRPLNGDYVPLGLAGIRYSSPGYLG